MVDRYAEELLFNGTVEERIEYAKKNLEADVDVLATMETIDLLVTHYWYAVALIPYEVAKNDKEIQRLIMFAADKIKHKLRI